MGEANALVMKFKIQSKMLEKQSKKELATERKERQVALAHLKKGERELARLHCQKATRAAKMSKFLAENANAVDEMVYNVQTSALSATVAQALKMTTEQMDRVISGTDPLRIQQLMDKYRELTGKTDMIGQITLDMTNAPMEVEALLDQIAQEIDQENDRVILAGSMAFPMEASYVPGEAMGV